MFLICFSALSWGPRNLPESTYFVGEWILVNCSNNTPDNVTLFKIKEKSGTDINVSGNKNIISAAKNIFNITNITNADKGKYVCKVCNSTSPVRRELKISKGKTD